MGKYKVEVVTQTDLIDFVSIATSLEKDVVVKVLNEDGSFICNGKSLLGVSHAMEWDSMYIDSNSDIYMKFAKFIVE
jgi:hypothetical protein